MKGPGGRHQNPRTRLVEYKTGTMGNKTLVSQQVEKDNHSIDSAINTCRYASKEERIGEICVPKSKALFAMPRRWKQPKCPSTDEEINVTCHHNRMWLMLSQDMDEFNITLNQRSMSYKDKN